MAFLFWLFNARTHHPFQVLEKKSSVKPYPLCKTLYETTNLFKNKNQNKCPIIWKNLGTIGTNSSVRSNNKHTLEAGNTRSGGSNYYSFTKKICRQEPPKNMSCVNFFSAAWRLISDFHLRRVMKSVEEGSFQIYDGTKSSHYFFVVFKRTSWKKIQRIVKI